ncbi:histidine phosphatase family protein [Granulicella sp. S190]|uniref:histidine phosphatase family protein n=1 Tax=Granulicella sp. S190 TaxID=1747226 RepID=UPI001575F65B|nr:histidine phosphatase family protein [Granulicella sp. S190]
MSEILFLRHAETDMAGTFCGHSDPEVNARGLEQIIELVDRFRGDNISTIYTSDLRRAHTTAEAIAKSCGIQCQIRPALREIYFGEWEGLTWVEIEQKDKAYARRWLEEYPRLPAPGGETFQDFERRVLSEVELLSAKVQGQRMAVVTHAGVLRTVLCSLNGCREEDAWRQSKPYCAIVRHAVVSPLPMLQAEVQV